MLNPKHIAVIGGDDGAIVVEQCRLHGFKGSIWAVNSRRQELGGVRCYSDISELPSAPDLAFVGVSKSATLPLIRRLSKLGAGGAVCFAAGFAETGEDGKLRQESLVGAANGMPLLGPNCYGIINNANGLAMWPYFHGCKTCKRGVALISQSGMLATSLTMNRRAVEFSHVVSIGNQAALGAEDLIDVLLEDPAVMAFALYLEGLRNPDKFAESVTNACRLGKPVVVMRSGSSDESRKISMSHTGSDSDTIDAVVERLQENGLIQVDTPSQLFETLKMVLHPVLPQGLRLAAFTCSGGDAALLADCAISKGLLLPQPGARAANVLRSLLPDIATVFNPLDCTTFLWGKPEIKQVFSNLIADPYDVAMFIQDYPRPDIPFDPTTDFAEAEAFVKAASDQGIPAVVCSTIPENIHEKARRFLRSVGAIPLQGVSEAMTAIAHAYRYQTARKRYIEQVAAERELQPETESDQTY